MFFLIGIPMSAAETVDVPGCSVCDGDFPLDRVDPPSSTGPRFQSSTEVDKKTIQVSGVPI